MSSLKRTVQASASDLICVSKFISTASLFDTDILFRQESHTLLFSSEVFTTAEAHEPVFHAVQIK
jgi:hypothetical protein